MDRATLKSLLDIENVDPAAYSLDGGMPFEAYVLERRASDWAVLLRARVALWRGCVRDGGRSLLVPPRPCASRLDNEAKPVTFRGRMSVLLRAAVIGLTALLGLLTLAPVVGADAGLHRLSVAMKGPHWWPGSCPQFGQVEIPTLRVVSYDGR